MSLYPLVPLPSQTTYTLFPAAAICGENDLRVLLPLTICSLEKFVPLSVLFSKYMSLYPLVPLPSHTTYTLFPAAAICGGYKLTVLLPVSLRLFQKNRVYTARGWI